MSQPPLQKEYWFIPVECNCWLLFKDILNTIVQYIQDVILSHFLMEGLFYCPSEKLKVFPKWE